ncbi:MAG: hypothetical protein ABSB53_04045 [Nitrososphaerales archaeon]
MSAGQASFKSSTRNPDDNTWFYAERLGISLLSKQEIRQNNVDMAFPVREGTDHRIGLTEQEK